MRLPGTPGKDQSGGKDMLVDEHPPRSSAGLELRTPIPFVLNAIGKSTGVVPSEPFRLKRGIGQKTQNANPP